MHSRWSKKCIPSKGTNDIEDRLSALPDEVILNILSFMSTQYAVKTMLLRRFGNLWTLVPTLRFDILEFDDMVNCQHKDGRQFDSYGTFRCFARLVRNVLMLHTSSTIDTFHLCFAEYNNYFPERKTADDIRMWLRIASDKKVKHLHFASSSGYDKIAPPRCVFTNQSLATLFLSGCELREEYGHHQPLIHMGALRKLTLIKVEGSNDAFNQLISGCPSLQKLRIKSPRGLQFLNVIAPSVSKLKLFISDVVDHLLTLNCPNVKLLEIGAYDSSRNNIPLFLPNVIDVSSLQQVNVEDLPVECPSAKIYTFVRQFQNVETFTLSRCAFKRLSDLREMDMPENRWKRLVLKPWWNHKRCLKVIYNLVMSSLKLEELIICSTDYSWHDDCEFVCPKLSPTHVMPPLKTVTIHGYEKGCEGPLQLVELFLVASTNATVVFT